MPEVQVPLHRQIPTVKVGGLPIAAITRGEWSKYFVACCREARGPGRKPVFLTSVNGNVLSQYARSEYFRRLMDRADASEADGQPLVFASRWLTQMPIPERCATTNFYHELADDFAREGLSYYFLGDTEEINSLAVERTRIEHPGLKIAGRQHGFFKREDEDALIARINTVAPDVLWVGLSVPYEHEFVVRNLDTLTNVGVIKTCGAMFNFVAGRKQRAPEWMQKLALGWVYRLVLEPRRLFWRHLTTNTHAL
jgi:N-acetylglucosaminyldiphosphoundecaprenol N-acetyl-beta-D-mannosaminyltransferase